MGFLSFLADPVGVYNIIKPSGQGSENAPSRSDVTVQRQKGAGQANAAASASSAGDYATAQHWYANGSHWSPGMPPPRDPNTVAYQDYVNYGKGQSNAAAAASAAGTNATQQHWDLKKTRDQAQANSDAAARQHAGLDMMQPGAAETFYQQHGGELTTPGSYQEWWNKNGAQMQSPGAAENYANQVLQKYGTGPQIAAPNYDTYYDRAATKATQGLNDQLASRGQYGSSVGLGLIGNQLADLAAQKAKDEANYDLARSGDQRAWMSAIGDTQQAADQGMLARWNAGGQGAALADTVGLSRWKTAEQAANDAQQAQRQRGQDLFNNERGIGGDLAGIVGSAYGANNATDSALLDAILSLQTGKASEGVAAAQTGANQDAATQNQLMQLLTAYYASQAGNKK